MFHLKAKQSPASRIEVERGKITLIIDKSTEIDGEPVEAAKEIIL